MTRRLVCVSLFVVLIVVYWGLVYFGIESEGMVGVMWVIGSLWGLRLSRYRPKKGGVYHEQTR